jgi:hypothetical protein
MLSSRLTVNPHTFARETHTKERPSARSFLGAALFVGYRTDLLRIGQIIERVRRRTRLPIGRLLSAAGAEVVQASTQQAHGWQYQPAPTGSEQGRAPQPKLAESQRQPEQVPKKCEVVSAKPAAPAERAATRLKSMPAAKSRALEPRPARPRPRRRKRGTAGPGIAKSRVSGMSASEVRSSGVPVATVRVERVSLSRRIARGRASLPGPIPGTRRRPRRTIRARSVGKARRAGRRRVTRPRHIPREAAALASPTSGTRGGRRPIGAEGGTSSRCASREGAPWIGPTPGSRRGGRRPIRAEVPTGRAPHSRCKSVSAVPERARRARRTREAARRGTAASGVAGVAGRTRGKFTRAAIRAIARSARRSGVTARRTTASAVTAANTETTRARSARPAETPPAKAVRSTGTAETAAARAVRCARPAETLSAAVENTARPTPVRSASVRSATAMMRSAPVRAAAFRVSAASIRSVWRGRQEEHRGGCEQEF